MLQRRADYSAPRQECCCTCLNIDDHLRRIAIPLHHERDVLVSYKTVEHPHQKVSRDERRVHLYSIYFPSVNGKNERKPSVLLGNGMPLCGHHQHQSVRVQPNYTVRLLSSIEFETCNLTAAQVGLAHRH